jgi:cytochrome c556
MPEIYKDPAAFRSRAEAMRAEVAKLQGVVKAGNEATIKEGIVELNRSCNACHDQFRAKR